MNVFELAVCILFVQVFIVYLLRHVRLKGKSLAALELQKNDFSNRKLFFIPIALFLVFITGLRNNMHTDYVNYQYDYEYKTPYLSIKEIFKEKEPLFGLLKKIVGELSDYNIVIFMTVLAVITVFFLTKTILDYSSVVWMSFFLLLTMGSYYTCFNTTRSYMAAAIFFYGCKYIYERDLPKYILCILLISMIHISSVIFLPMYWILPMRWNKKRNLIVTSGAILLAVYIYFRFESLIIYTTRFVYTMYEVGEGKVMSSQTVLTLARPLLFVVFILFNFRTFDYNDRKERCWFNAVIYWMIISVFATQITLVQRFTYYLIPFTFLAVPVVITRSKSKMQKYMWICILLLCGIAYSVLGQFKSPFSFFWEENVSYLNM